MVQHLYFTSIAFIYTSKMVIKITLNIITRVSLVATIHMPSYMKIFGDIQKFQFFSKITFDTLKFRPGRFSLYKKFSQNPVQMLPLGCRYLRHKESAGISSFEKYRQNPDFHQRRLLIHQNIQYSIFPYKTFSLRIQYKPIH